MIGKIFAYLIVYIALIVIGIKLYLWGRRLQKENQGQMESAFRTDILFRPDYHPVDRFVSAPAGSLKIGIAVCSKNYRLYAGLAQGSDRARPRQILVFGAATGGFRFCLRLFWGCFRRAIRYDGN